MEGIKPDRVKREKVREASPDEDDSPNTSAMNSPSPSDINSPTSSALNSPAPTPPRTPGSSGHRSRKEKLVLRSFSTEIDEIQPKILSHEEFFGSPSTRKRGTRNRRTASAPVSSSKSQSREQSPAPLSEEDDEDPLDGGGGAGETKNPGASSTPSRSKKYRKQKDIKKSAQTEEGAEEEDDDFVNVDVVDDITKDAGGKPMKKLYRSKGLKSNTVKEGREKSTKRRDEWNSPIKTRRKRLPIDISFNKKTSPKVGKTSSSSKYTRRLIPPRNSKSSIIGNDTIKRINSISSISGANSGKSKVTFMDPAISSASAGKPIAKRPSTTPSSSNSSLSASSTHPAPPPPRKLVKYKVPEKFSKIMADNHERNAAASAESYQGGISKLVTELIQNRSSATEKQSVEETNSEIRKSILLPPPPAPTSSPFTPPQPPAQSQEHVSPNTAPLPSPESEESLTYTAEQQELDYARGYAALRDLMSSYTSTKDPEGRKSLSFTLPDFCKESVAKITSMLSKCPIQDKSKKLKPPRDADKDSSSSSEEDEESTTPLSVSESIPPLLSFTRNVICESEKTKEMARLLSIPRAQDEFNPRFVVGSYLAPARPSHPRLTVKELEVFEELMTPDDNFMLYEDEQEAVNLWCELIRSELKEIQNDRKMKAEMEALLKDNQNNDTGKKIVDAYAIMINPEDRHLYPADCLMKQEDFVKLIMKGKENNVKELNTRRLRNGKEVPLKKIHLPGVKRRKSDDIRGADKRGRSHSIIERRHTRRPYNLPSPSHMKDAATVPATKVNGTDHISSVSKKISIMKLRDGKEILLPASPRSNAICQIHIPEIIQGSTVNGKKQDKTMPSPSKPDEYSQRVEASLRRLEASGGTIPTSPGEMLDVAFSSSGGMESSHQNWSSINVNAMPSSSRCRTQPLGRGSNIVVASTSGSGSNISSIPTATSPKNVTDIFNFNTGYSNQSFGGIDSPTCSPNFIPFPPGSDGSSSLSYLVGSSSNSSYMFKPIQSYPLTSPTSTVTSGSYSISGHQFLPRNSVSSHPYQLSGNSPTLSSSPFGQGYNYNFGASKIGAAASANPLLASSLNKSRYSRQKHSTLCPPFDNNHCSYNGHHCSYPRAPNSRFCIHHVNEGATVNFERCKYVKGSRDCGGFVPRSSSQGLFCDQHSLAIANARVKKSRPRKPADKSEGLLKHMRCNLDRSEGKIMEPDALGCYSVRKDFIDDEFDTLNNSSNSDESDDESVMTMQNAQKGDDDSDVDDCDPIGVDGDDPDYGALKNAGYYTVEECVKLSRSALDKQKQCMLQEMELIKRKLSYGWKTYYQKIRALRSHQVNFTTDPKFVSTASGLTPEQIQQQVKGHNDITAMMSHRRNTGPRAILRAKTLMKRQQIFESSRPPGSVTSESSPFPLHPSETKEDITLRLRRARRGHPQSCMYGAGGGTHEKCKEKAIPLSRFCFTHVIHDKTQHLLVPCNFRLGPDSDDMCTTPILSELEKFGCPLHALPIPLKDPPESQNKKAKVEEEIDKLMEEPSMDSSGDEGDVSAAIDSATVENESDDQKEPGVGVEQKDQDEGMILEMEHLIGDEVVDMDHFKETLAAVYSRGLYVTDSEESEDTEEEEEGSEEVPPVYSV